MAAWTEDELNRIAVSDDLHVAAFREDGKTYGTPTWIWSVVVDDALFVRAYNGKASRWHQAAIRQKDGRIGLLHPMHPPPLKATLQHPFNIHTPSRGMVKVDVFHG